MGSRELVAFIREYRKGVLYEGLSVRDAVKHLASFGLLSNRQIADALGVSHTLVNRYAKENIDDDVPVPEYRIGVVNWEDIDRIESFLAGTDVLLPFLVDMGSSERVLQWLRQNTYR